MEPTERIEKTPDVVEVAATVVELNGRIDAINSIIIEEKLDKIADNSKKILLDMKEVEYISSAGLRTLLKLLQKVKKEKGEVALCNLDPNVKDVFELTGFDALFIIAESRDEGLERLKD